MRCDEARRLWSLYHDSEGDADTHYRISEHLSVCPDCAEWFHVRSDLENRLTERLRDNIPDEAMWSQVLQQAVLSQGESRRRSSSWAYDSRRFWIAASLGGVVCLLSLFWLSAWYFSPDLSHLTAQWHTRLEAGEETLQFRSESDEEVENYLRERVTFPVRCPPRQDSGFKVQGAGVFRLADHPAAYLSGSVDSAPVSIFVLPSHSLQDFPRQRQALKRSSEHRASAGEYAVVWGVIDQNAVMVVGQAESRRLQRVLQAYGSYPDHH